MTRPQDALEAIAELDPASAAEAAAGGVLEVDEEQPHLGVEHVPGMGLTARRLLELMGELL